MKKLERRYTKQSRVIAKADLSYWGMLIDLLVIAALGALVAVLMMYAPKIEGTFTKSADVQYLTDQNLKWVLLGVGVFAIITLIIHFFVVNSRELIISEKDLIYRTGRFVINSHIIPLDEIKLIQSKQNFFNQITGAGTIIVTSEGDAKLKIKGIRRPEKFVARAIEQADKQKSTANLQNISISVK